MTSQLTRTCQLSKKLKKNCISLSPHRLHSIVHLFLIKKWGCQLNATRQLLSARLRVPVCPLDGLLPHSDLHPSFPHRRHILGQLLVITTALAPKSPQNSEQQQNLCPATWKIKATFNELEKITFPVQVQTLSSCKVKWPNVHILRIIILGLFWRGKALAHVSGQAEPGGDTSEGDAGRDHCAHHDHPHLQHQRLPSQDILRQIDRRLLSFLLFHGLCQPDRWVGIRSKQHEVCCRRSSRWKHISLRPLATPTTYNICITSFVCSPACQIHIQPLLSSPMQQNDSLAY